MVNPQTPLDHGILTQFSELSDLTSSNPPSDAKLPPKRIVLKGGNTSVHLQMGGGNTPGSSSSSSPSFKSPGSASTESVSLLTQPAAEDAPTVVNPPSVKRKLEFKKVCAVPEKKIKKEPGVKCCGRCDELKTLCLNMASKTHPTIKATNQYKVHAKNSKYRAIFYQSLKCQVDFDELPDCVLEYVRALYPSAPTK